jgi:hypothetical protein
VNNTPPEPLQDDHRQGDGLTTGILGLAYECLFDEFAVAGFSTVACPPLWVVSGASFEAIAESIRLRCARQGRDCWARWEDGTTSNLFTSGPSLKRPNIVV